MKIYHENLDALQQFTLALISPGNTTACLKCQKKGQLMSHAFVYKQQNNNDKKVAGKRVFCSNRDGKSGCGASIRQILC